MELFAKTAGLFDGFATGLTAGFGFEGFDTGVEVGFFAAATGVFIAGALRGVLVAF